MGSAGTYNLDTSVWGFEGSSYPRTVQETTGSDLDALVGSITSYWDSKDFTIPERYLSENARWLEVELQLKGTQVTIQYSLDEGGTWTTLKEDQTLTSTWTLFKYYVDKVSRTFRIRIKESSTSKTFEFRYLRVWFRPGGAR